MHRIILTLLWWVMSLAPLMAQNYIKSAGLRLGHTKAITYKMFFERDKAVEMLVSGREGGIQLNAQFQQYSPAQFNFDENFSIYYGMGGHFGFERYYSFELLEPGFTTVPDDSFRKGTYSVMGLDAIVGIEYRAIAVPITISLDMKPYLSVIGFRFLRGRFWDAGLSVKYTFTN